MAVAVLVAVAVLSGCANDGAASSAPGVIVHRKAHDVPGPLTTVSPIAKRFKSVTGTRVKIPSGNGIPNRFTIWRDPYEAKWIGTTSTGEQFYLGTQYNFAGTSSDAYEDLFLFTSSGTFQSATIVDFGRASGVASDFDTNVDQMTEGEARSQLLSSLGQFRRTDIFIQPFAVKAYGLKFGFIPQLPDPSDLSDTVSIQLLPANNMAFSPPWTYGHYDT
jgi:hypothetical protein